MTFFNNVFENDIFSEISELPLIEVPRGKLILKENVYIKEIPLLIDGNIKVRKTDESGREIILYHIQSGESCILSITSCLNEQKSRAEAITEEDSKIVVVPAVKVREWMDSSKSWRRFVIQLYNSRMDSLLSLVDSISFKQTDSRLYAKLKELNARLGSDIKITHQQLANEIGTAREVISRLLKQLEKQGYILLDRGIIKIIQPL